MNLLHYILSHPEGRRVGWSWLPRGREYFGWRHEWNRGETFAFGLGPAHVFVYWE